jgi:sulfur-oxidizing protein SoxA
MRHRLTIVSALGAVFASFTVGAEELVDFEIDGTSIPDSLTGQPGDAELGRAVAINVTQGNCLACHEIPALGDQPFHGDVGPSLAGVARRYDEGQLRLRVVDPKVVNPDSIMPAFYRNQGFHNVMPKFEGKPILTAEQVEDVVAFLLTLDDAGETITIGRIPAPEQPETIEPPAGSALPELISGYEFATPQTRELQADDFVNPAFLWIDRGAELWAEVDGAAGKSCAACHDSAEETMKGVGATYPKYHEGTGRPINLEQRINLCRTEQMQAEPWAWESEPLLAMTTYVKHQSRGMPIAVAVEGPAAPFFTAGKELYYQRRGTIDMACKHCHNDNYGKHLRAQLLSQGQSNGFPAYRLFAQSVISLHRLVSEICYSRVRAVPPKPESDEYVSLELYLAWRGSGLPVETPAVRQ